MIGRSLKISFASGRFRIQAHGRITAAAALRKASRAGSSALQLLHPVGVKSKFSCAGAVERGIFPRMRFRLPGGKSIAPRAIVAAGTLSAFLWMLTLTVSPSLHERIHSDANRAEHSCAVTLIGSGSCNHSAPLPLVSAPVPAIQFSTIPALHPLWVPSPFLGARIFEHAPPAK